jgi:hypothetical protein
MSSLSSPSKRACKEKKPPSRAMVAAVQLRLRSHDGATETAANNNARHAARPRFAQEVRVGRADMSVHPKVNQIAELLLRMQMVREER